MVPSALAWTETSGQGSINGNDFPIAVVQDPGAVDHFKKELQLRFGPTYQIFEMPAVSGRQFIVQPFTSNELLTLPLRNADAVEEYVAKQTMSFSYYEIGNETLAIGTPVEALMKAAPSDHLTVQPIAALKGLLTNITEITFRFANVEVYSMSGTVTGDQYDTTVAIRHHFETNGLSSPEPKKESTIAQDDNPFTFYMDGKSTAANFALLKSNHSNEVRLNVNQVKIK